MTTIDSIARDVHVTLAYSLHDIGGETLDGTPEGEPISFVYGYGIVVPGLEKALLGLSKGTKKSVQVAPEEGFGLRDDELVFEIDRGDLPEAINVGDTFFAEDEAGHQESLKILEIHTAHVLVDANHPLAGATLRYDIHVVGLRAATADEIADAKRDHADPEASDHESGPLLIPEARRSQPPPPQDN